MRRGIILYGLLGALASAGAAQEHPIAVSPEQRIESHCPTFSWSPVPEATSYDLVVYTLDEDGFSETQVVMQETIPGGGLSWTPSMNRCLEEGRLYAWAVRGRNREALTDWSQPSLFEVAAGPSEREFEEALAVVRAYLQGSRDAGSGEALGAAIPRKRERGCTTRRPPRQHVAA